MTVRQSSLVLLAAALSLPAGLGGACAESAPPLSGAPAAPDSPADASPPPGPDAATPGLVEASGIAVRGGGKVAIIAGDETTDHLWAVSLGDLSRRWPLPLPLNIGGMDDIEALAPWGENDLFVICSQSRTKPRAKARPERQRLALLMLTPDAQQILHGRVCDSLRDALVRHVTGRLRDVLDNPSAIESDSPLRGGLNVEGLAPWKGRLLIGLRSPVARTGAIVVPLRAPDVLFADPGRRTPDLDDPYVLPTAPREGIRDLAADGDSILVLLGSPTDEDDPPFRLVRWDPAANTIREVDPPGFRAIPKPEGIAVDPEGRLLVVQDRKPPLPPQVLYRLDLPRPTPGAAPPAGR